MRILVAVDFSDNSRRAVDMAKQLAQPARDEVMLVHVANMLTKDALTNFMVGFDSQIVDSANREKVDDAIFGLRLLETELAGAGITVECTALAGDAKDVLVEEIKKQKPDLVIVGQRGLSKAERFFLGSVSEHLSKHAHCSVLIVK